VRRRRAEPRTLRATVGYNATMRGAAALAASLALLAGCAGDEPDGPERPPFVPAPAAAEPEPGGRWLTARLTGRTVLRDAPGGRRLARLGTRTEFGSRRVLSVTRRRDGWLAVVTPERPNGRQGWIPERRARLGGTDWSLHVDRAARRLTVRRDGRAVRSFPVAVGRPGTPTPTGRFAVTDKLHPRPGSPYGCCALALSGHQTKLVPGWPGGDRLAIHATPQEETVGTRASLGCLRARERDVRRLMRTVPVGTPVFVRA
jgi:hypothetical protein